MKGVPTLFYFNLIILYNLTITLKLLASINDIYWRIEFRINKFQIINFNIFGSFSFSCILTLLLVSSNYKKTCFIVSFPKTVGRICRANGNPILFLWYYTCVYVLMSVCNTCYYHYDNSMQRCYCNVLFYKSALL